ncbi:MAG: hypothetical protein ABGZ17_27070 [Planctomycetaceae bacterium]
MKFSAKLWRRRLVLAAAIVGCGFSWMSFPTHVVSQQPQGRKTVTDRPVETSKSPESTQDVDAKPSKPNDKPAAPGKSEKPRVTIRVEGDRVLFESQDTKALDDVQDVIEKLARENGPESSKPAGPKTARTIQLRFANVDEVADIIRVVYADYLKPVAASDKNALPEVRLGLALDRPRKLMVVISDEATFLGVRELALQREDAALRSEGGVELLDRRGDSTVARAQSSRIPRVEVIISQSRSDSMLSTTTFSPQQSSSSRSSSSRSSSSRSSSSRSSGRSSGDPSRFSSRFGGGAPSGGSSRFGGGSSRSGGGVPGGFGRGGSGFSRGGGR